jgi:ribosome-associated protein
LTEERQRREAKELVMQAAKAADDKQAADILILELAQLLVITDYFLICSGATDRQTRTIAEEVRKQVKEMSGRKPIRAAGEELGDWILLDYGDVVIHIFTQEMREYYQLERLWRGAPKIAREAGA